MMPTFLIPDSPLNSSDSTAATATEAEINKRARRLSCLLSRFAVTETLLRNWLMEQNPMTLLGSGAMLTAECCAAVAAWSRSGECRTTVEEISTARNRFQTTRHNPAIQGGDSLQLLRGSWSCREAERHRQCSRSRSKATRFPLTERLQYGLLLSFFG